MFTIGHQANGPGQLCLEDLNTPQTFGERFFKDRVREGVCGVCDQLVDLFLTGQR